MSVLLMKKTTEEIDDPYLDGETDDKPEPEAQK